MLLSPRKKSRDSLGLRWLLGFSRFATQGVAHRIWGISGPTGPNASVARVGCLKSCICPQQILARAWGKGVKQIPIPEKRALLFKIRSDLKTPRTDPKDKAFSGDFCLFLRSVLPAQDRTLKISVLASLGCGPNVRCPGLPFTQERAESSNGQRKP